MTRVLFFGMMLGSLAGAACDSRSAQEPPAAAPPRADRSPAEVVLQLQSAFRERRYAEVAEMVVPAGRTSVVDFLVAIDEVLAANRRLRAAAEKAFSGPVSETWSIGEIENNIGPFSARVTLIGQELRGDAAIVTLQEGEHIPLFKARLVQTAQGWRYAPEPIAASMIGELRRLAATLDGVTEKVRQGASVEYYLDAFFSQVAPHMVRVMTATDPASSLAAAGSDSAP